MNKQQLSKISMGIVAIFLAILSVVIYTHTISRDSATHISTANGKVSDSTRAPQEQAELKLYQKMLLITLYPYIQKSVTGYYTRNDVLSPPDVDSILSARNTKGAVYEIEIEAQPYVGPHDGIGIDHITIQISPTKIQVLKFQHIKSFSLPPNL